MVKIARTPVDPFVLILRKVLPVLLHVLNLSSVNLFRKKRGNFLDLQTDLSSILFSVLINIFLGSRKSLLPRAYQPSSPSNIAILNVS